MKKRKLDKKKAAILNKIVTFAIIVGVATMVYPLISQVYYKIKENGEAIVFEKNIKSASEVEINKKMKLYEKYNNSLRRNKLLESGNREYDDGINEYRRMIGEHEKIGFVAVPSIDQNLPIFAGVSEEMLEKGAGQMQGTSLPIGGKGNHSVIAAHSGIPNVRLFTDLKKVKIGDEFYITNIKETIAYKVDSKKVVLPTDFRDIEPVAGKDYVTLMTCTPYRVNTHRLLVRGHRIKYNPKEVEKKKKMIVIKTVVKVFTVTIAVGIAIRYYYIKKRR